MWIQTIHFSRTSPTHKLCSLGHINISPIRSCHWAHTNSQIFMDKFKRDQDAAYLCILCPLFWVSSALLKSSLSVQTSHLHWWTEQNTQQPSTNQQAITSLVYNCCLQLGFFSPIQSFIYINTFGRKPSRDAKTYSYGFMLHLSWSKRWLLVTRALLLSSEIFLHLSVAKWWL